MITQDERIAAQIIEGILQFLGLRDREIARVRHLVVLPLQQALPNRFA